MQLLCNGVFVDLYENTKIQFTHDNPLFAFDSLKCERTTQFKLPTTKKNDSLFESCRLRVRIRGLEPPPSCPDQNLNLTRLPIPPYPHILLCSCTAAPGTIVIIPDTNEKSRLNFKIIRQIFAAKLVHSGQRLWGAFQGRLWYNKRKATPHNSRLTA